LERLGTTFGAVVTVTRGRALAEAAAADRDIARGRWRGPLHGIPYGVKDLLAAAGYPTTWGAAPYDNQLFAEDATVVARLKAAGAATARWPCRGRWTSWGRWGGAPKTARWCWRRSRGRTPTIPRPWNVFFACLTPWAPLRVAERGNEGERYGRGASCASGS